MTRTYSDLRDVSGLPIGFNTTTSDLNLGAVLNQPSYRVRRLHDLDAVWAGNVVAPDRVIYRYTNGLHLPGDADKWAAANVVYGIVIFGPGVYDGEYVKSSGQYHPPTPPSGMGTPEIYTVLSGTGLFLLQKARPPYDRIEDVILVEVQAGETVIVPPDYGHLQINPLPEPLVFSYAVMDGMKGQYKPFKKRQGAACYVMENGRDGGYRCVANPRYPEAPPVRIIRASDICQLPEVNDRVTYQTIRDHLPELTFLTDPTAFATAAAL